MVRLDGSQSSHLQTGTRKVLGKTCSYRAVICVSFQEAKVSPHRPNLPHNKTTEEIFARDSALSGRKGGLCLVPVDAKRGFEDVASNVGAVLMNPGCRADGDIRTNMPSW